MNFLGSSTDTIVTLAFDPEGRYMPTIDWKGILVPSQVNANTFLYYHELKGKGGANFKYRQSYLKKRH